MLEQGDAATLAANGPATLGAMAEAEANEDEEEEEEKPFMELSVAGSGRTGQGACVVCGWMRDGGWMRTEKGEEGNEDSHPPHPPHPPMHNPTDHSLISPPSIHNPLRTPSGVLDLLRAIDEALRSIMVHVEVLLPYSEASVLSQVSQLGWTLETWAHSMQGWHAWRLTHASNHTHTHL